MISIKINKRNFEFDPQNLPQDGQRMISYMEQRIEEIIESMAEDSYRQILKDKKVKNIYFKTFYETILDFDEPEFKLHFVTSFTGTHDKKLASCISKYLNSELHKQSVIYWILDQ